MMRDIGSIDDIARSHAHADDFACQAAASAQFPTIIATSSPAPRDGRIALEIIASSAALDRPPFMR